MATGRRVGTAVFAARHGQRTFRPVPGEPRLPHPVAALAPYIQQPADSATFIRHAIEKFARGEGLTTAIEYQGEVVGVIGYNQIDQALAKVTIGYWLAERWQGNGIITRACQALIHHAFEEMGMEKVEISAAVENEPSRAVCERLGMQQEGITRRAERLADRVVDHVHYGLLRDDWLRQRDH